MVKMSNEVKKLNNSSLGLKATSNQAKPSSHLIMLSIAVTILPRRAQLGQYSYLEKISYSMLIVSCLQ